jgi:hypothetical protein
MRRCTTKEGTIIAQATQLRDPFDRIDSRTEGPVGGARAAAGEVFCLPLVCCDTVSKSE